MCKRSKKLKNVTLPDSPKVVVSSCKFEVRPKTSYQQSNHTSIVGHNGVVLQQYPDGSLLPPYHDIHKFPIVAKTTPHDVSDENTTFLK